MNTAHYPIINDYLVKSTELLLQMRSDTALQESLSDAIDLINHCLSSGGKLLFAGNGGSAADAQHMAAEYVCRFRLDRPGLPAIALTTDTSALTAIGNDYGFDSIFARQVQALGQPGDILIAYSTSGTSKNIIAALEAAKAEKIKCIGMTGSKLRSSPMADLCDLTIHIPSTVTAHIQEGHLITGHIVCYAIEELMFGSHPEA